MAELLLDLLNIRLLTGDQLIANVRKHQAWKNLTFLFLKETLRKENLQLAEEQIGSQSQQRLHQSSSHLR